MKVIKYIDKQKDKAVSLVNSDVYGNDRGNGVYKRGNNHPFILNDCRNNIYHEIRSGVFDYLKENDISYDGMEHMLNSQAACLNHLFPIRKNKAAVLNILKAVSPGFDDVYPISENMEEYIEFESVGGKENLLNEGTNFRGRLNTSIDALIYASHNNGKRYLIPIEWKYAESYGNKVYFDAPKKSRGGKTSGQIRQSRYYELIEKSRYLIPVNAKECGNYDPFYQLVRQTLWAEQVSQHVPCLRADDIFHIHVIPNENHELLNKRYICSGKDMVNTWRDCLVYPDNYKVIDPAELWSNQPTNTKLYQYLKLRYWS